MLLPLKICFGDAIMKNICINVHIIYHLLHYYLSVCLSVCLSVFLSARYVYHPTCIVQSGAIFGHNCKFALSHNRAVIKFWTPVALIYTPMTNLLLCEYIKPTRGKFTRNTEQICYLLPRRGFLWSKGESVTPLPLRTPAAPNRPASNKNNNIYVTNYVTFPLPFFLASGQPM